MGWRRFSCMTIDLVFSAILGAVTSVLGFLLGVLLFASRRRMTTPLTLHIARYLHRASNFFLRLHQRSLGPEPACSVDEYEIEHEGPPLPEAVTARIHRRVMGEIVRKQNQSDFRYVHKEGYLYIDEGEADT